jgi:hypothetical protein
MYSMKNSPSTGSNLVSFKFRREGESSVDVEQ